MGHTSIPNWLARGDWISANAKLVLLVIQSRAGTKGSCYPSINSIAADAGVSRSTVKRALSELVGRNIIAVDQRWTGKGRTSSLYRMLVDPNDPDPRVHSEPRGGSSQDHHEEEPLEEEPLSKTSGGVLS